MSVKNRTAYIFFIFLHKDIVFRKVVIPYKAQDKDLEYTIK